MAYDLLDKKTRARADELIRRHPDYARFSEGVGGNPQRIARWAFIHAAAWADDIKFDERFYDDTRSDVKPASPIPPFPDMKRHTNWHYVNLYFSPDETPLPDTPTINAQTELPRMVERLGGDQGWYYLPWLLHVEGDAHQPMHCVSRLTKALLGNDGKPTSDLGGNLTVVDDYTNLHTVWDDLLGVTQDENYIDWMAARLRKEHARPNQLSLDPMVWTQEGFDLARTRAYAMPADVGTREHPFRTTRAYWADALRVAQSQAALAAYRLAAVLNDRLQ